MSYKHTAINVKSNILSEKDLSFSTCKESHLFHDLARLGQSNPAMALIGFIYNIRLFTGTR